MGASVEQIADLEKQRLMRRDRHMEHEHDFDGRPTVEDDPLLARLRKYHSFVDAPRLGLNPEQPDAPDSSG